MKSLKFSVFFDGFLIYLSAFFLFYRIIRYGGAKFLPALLLTALLSSFASLFIIFLASKKQNKHIETLKNKDNLIFFTNYLYLSPKKEILNLLNKFYKIFFTLVKLNKYSIEIEIEKILIIPYFDKQELTLDDVALIYKSLPNGYRAVILCCNYNGNCPVFIQKFNLNATIYNALDIYVALKEKGLLPTKENQIDPPKKLAFLLKSAINKSNFKKFVVIGLFTILTSFFTRFSIYYIVFGGAFLILAVYVKLFKNENLTEQKKQSALT